MAASLALAYLLEWVAGSHDRGQRRGVESLGSCLEASSYLRVQILIAEKRNKKHGHSSPSSPCHIACYPRRDYSEYPPNTVQEVAQ